MKIKIVISLLYILCMSRLAHAQVDVNYNVLVWADEFEYTGAIDASKWHHQTQLPAGGNWYNGEVQHYTNRIQNSFAENGVLKIRAIKENFSDQGFSKSYTSARLNSKFAFVYGRIDIRAKIPTQQGTWPALWMLGKNITEPGGFFSDIHGNTPWPACGEIDIMEHGITPAQLIEYVQSAIHTPSSFGNTMNVGGIIANNLGNDFHVYSMNWSPNQITFLLDGVAYYTYNPSPKNASTWPFNNPQYILMNIAMGGVAGNIPGNFTQATMEIDYVHVYQNSLSASRALVEELQIVNPIQSFIQLPNSFERNHVRLYNSSGQLILQSSNSIHIACETLAPGMYMIIVDSNDQVFRRKIVKQ